MLEATCTRCQETFVPQGVENEDLIHGEEESGMPCGGIGIITGEWIAPAEIQSQMTWRVGEMVNLRRFEAHGLEFPDCKDPDCEFHHPEVREYQPSMPTQEYPYGKGNQGPGTGPDGERLI